MSEGSTSFTRTRSVEAVAARPYAVPFRLLTGVVPTRRLLAVDAGSQTVKLVLVEEMFGRCRVLQQRLLEPAGEGEDSRDDCLLRVRSLLAEVGDCPVALALPHYRALSQVLDLPVAGQDDVEAAIEEESQKLSGLGESQIVHDFSRLTPFGKLQNPFWVTFCQEGEVQNQIGRCGLADLDLCEVTTTSNALVAAYQARQPGNGPTALVDVGAMGTLVTILLEGQPVYAAGFAMGTELWAEVLSHAESCPLPIARERLRAVGFTLEASDALRNVLRRWHGELARLVGEWTRDNTDLNLKSADLECVLTGGGAELPGLPEALSALPGLRFAAWPEGGTEGHVSPRFAVAYGTALHALGRASHPASLLPEEVRHYWRRSHLLQLLQSLLLLALVLLTLALGLGTWQKLGLESEKSRWYEQGFAALSTARNVATLDRENRDIFQHLRPVLQRQRETLDTLDTLALLQESRSNRSYWYVLFAGGRDYFLAAPWPSTNAPPTTNSGPANPYLPSRPGFVVELCVPESGESGRRIVSQLVNDLRATGRYQNVDSLPDDRRRPLADPHVLLPEGHVALQLETLMNPFATHDLTANRRYPRSASNGDVEALDAREVGWTTVEEE